MQTIRIDVHKQKSQLIMRPIALTIATFEISDVQKNLEENEVHDEPIVEHLREQIGMLVIQKDKMKQSYESQVNALQKENVHLREQFEENSRLREQVESLTNMLTDAATAKEESTAATKKVAEFEVELKEKRAEAEELERDLKETKQTMEGYKQRCQIYEMGSDKENTSPALSPAPRAFRRPSIRAPASAPVTTVRRSSIAGNFSGLPFANLHEEPTTPSSSATFLGMVRRASMTASVSAIPAPNLHETANETITTEPVGAIRRASFFGMGRGPSVSGASQSIQTQRKNDSIMTTSQYVKTEAPKSPQASMFSTLRNKFTSPSKTWSATSNTDDDDCSSYNSGDIYFDGGEFDPEYVSDDECDLNSEDAGKYGYGVDDPRKYGYGEY